MRRSTWVAKQSVVGGLPVGRRTADRSRPPGTLFLGGGGRALTVATALTGGNGLTAFGPGSSGTLILTGSNSYSGSTTIGSGGTLEFANAATQTLNGNISGGGSLTQLGPGMLTLAGNNTYTGNTTIDGGTLAVNGQVASATSRERRFGRGPQRRGTVGGLIQIFSGGGLAPGHGATAGTLFAGNLLLESGGILNYTLATAQSNSSYLSSAATSCSIAGDVECFRRRRRPGPWNLSADRRLLLADLDAERGADDRSVPASLSGDSFSFATSGNVLDLVISASSSTINGQWAVNGGGTWSTPANWSDGVPGYSRVAARTRPSSARSWPRGPPPR